MTKRSTRARNDSGLTAEAVAKWAESRASETLITPPIVPAPRHPPGRGSGMTPDEIRDVRLDFLCDGLTRVALATKYGRTRNTIAGCLEGKDFEDFRASVLEQAAVDARIVLASKTIQHARNWNTASDIAALKGDHRPARDALVATGVVQPRSDAPGGVNVFIVTQVNGLELYRSQRTGRTYSMSQIDGGHIPSQEQADTIVWAGGAASIRIGGQTVAQEKS
jgi:hypothetical protein